MGLLRTLQLSELKEQTAVGCWRSDKPRPKRSAWVSRCSCGNSTLRHVVIPTLTSMSYLEDRISSYASPTTSNIKSLVSSEKIEVISTEYSLFTKERVENARRYEGDEGYPLGCKVEERLAEGGSPVVSDPPSVVSYSAGNLSRNEWGASLCSWCFQNKISRDIGSPPAEGGPCSQPLHAPASYQGFALHP